jgi:hypothetical protein
LIAGKQAFASGSIRCSVRIISAACVYNSEGGYHPRIFSLG